MPKYKSMIDFLKRQLGVCITVDTRTWIIYTGEEWVVYQRAYHSKTTRILYRGTDEAIAISHAIGNNNESSQLT